ncbi:MAG TPA: MBL fold metallo-hydrolase [Syntrophales bacterium]|nr:MBL fold metallo-hydrolase [Syntrophales bacterium]HOM07843.1 MBL fold metallo-hydrolase [Syntrophales bacterium]HPQ07334.1 MBL fold metallo-hydrolase [Syntrophales bacterium]
MIMESRGLLAEGVYGLGVPDLPAYLLLGERPALFDGGITIAGPLYIKDLREILGDEGRLVFNFLTHSHFDHAGSTPYLRRKIPGLKVGAHPLAAENLRKPGAVALIRSLCEEFETKYAGLIAGEDVGFSSFDVEILLEDGMEVDLGGGMGFRVIHTPGHTRDALTFWLPRQRALITGEAAGVFDRNYAIQPEFLSSYNDYLASLERLARYEADCIMMSHYFTLTGEDARGYIPRSIEATVAFRRRIEAYLAEAHGERDAVVKRIYEEDFVGTGAVMQESRPYLLNLEAKVRCVADDR